MGILSKCRCNPCRFVFLHRRFATSATRSSAIKGGPIQHEVTRVGDRWCLDGWFGLWGFIGTDRPLFWLKVCFWRVWCMWTANLWIWLDGTMVLLLALLFIYWIYRERHSERERERVGCLAWLHLSCRITTSSSRSLNYAIILSIVLISFDWSLSKGIPLDHCHHSISTETPPHMFYGSQNVFNLRRIEQISTRLSKLCLLSTKLLHKTYSQLTQPSQGWFGHRLGEADSRWVFCHLAAGFEVKIVKECSKATPELFVWYLDDVGFCHPTGWCWLVVWTPNSRGSRADGTRTFAGKLVGRADSLAANQGGPCFLRRCICQGLHVRHLQLLYIYIW